MRSLRPLTQQERDTLEERLKQTKDISEWKRLFVLLSYDEGQSLEELARLTRLSQWTLEKYLKDYSSDNKTKNDPRGGGSSKLTEAEGKQLEEHLSNTTYLKVKSIVDYVHKTFRSPLQSCSLCAALTRFTRHGHFWAHARLLRI